MTLNLTRQQRRAAERRSLKAPPSVSPKGSKPTLGALKIARNMATQAAKRATYNPSNGDQKMKEIVLSDKQIEYMRAAQSDADGAAMPIAVYSALRDKGLVAKNWQKRSGQRGYTVAKLTPAGRKWIDA